MESFQSILDEKSFDENIIALFIISDFHEDTCIMTFDRFVHLCTNEIGFSGKVMIVHIYCVDRTGDLRC